MNVNAIIVIVRNLVQALYGFELSSVEEQIVKGYAHELLRGLPKRPAVLCSVDGVPWNFRAAVDDLCPQFLRERRDESVPWELDEPTPERKAELSAAHLWEKSRRAARVYRRDWRSGRHNALKVCHQRVLELDFQIEVCEQPNKRVGVPKATRRLHGRFRRDRLFVRVQKQGLAA